jgi:hypothetical protein
MQTLEYPCIIKNVHTKKLYEKIVTFFHIAFKKIFYSGFFSNTHASTFAASIKALRSNVILG